MTTYFDKFTGSNDATIQKTSSLLEQVTSQYKAGALSKGEYEELCGDLLDTQVIENNITDMRRKQELLDAYQALSAIVSTIISL